MKRDGEKAKSRAKHLPLVGGMLGATVQGVRQVRAMRRIRAYSRWLESNTPDQAALAKQRIDSRGFTLRPLISIIVPTYNTPSTYFRDMVQSVLDQTYDNWELILVDDASPEAEVRSLINEAATRDPRITKLFLKKNHHIAGATNKAIQIARGEFVSLFDHDDLLYPNTLYEVVRAINEQPQTDFIYTDEDKIVGDTPVRKDPFFKPDWNPDLLWSINYITHFTTIRKTVLDQFGYEDEAYPGAQDWELFLRITRNLNPERICHIPKVLYSWRIHTLSTAMSLDAKPYVIESQKKAVRGDLNAKGYHNHEVEQDATYQGQWRVRFIPSEAPRVSIIITAKNKKAIAAKLKSSTKYPNYEVIASDEGSLTHDLIKKLAGSYIVIVDGNVGDVSPNWIEIMLGDAMRPEIGCVVARYRSNADVMKNISAMINPVAVDLVHTMNHKEISRHYYTTAKYNIPSVFPGSAVMVEATKLQDAIDTNEQSVDFASMSAKLAAKGYRHLYNPYIKVLR